MAAITWVPWWLPFSVAQVDEQKECPEELAHSKRYILFISITRNLLRPVK